MKLWTPFFILYDGPRPGLHTANRKAFIWRNQGRLSHGRPQSDSKRTLAGPQSVDSGQALIRRAPAGLQYIRMATPGLSYGGCSRASKQRTLIEPLVSGPRPSFRRRDPSSRLSQGGLQPDLQSQTANPSRTFIRRTRVGPSIGGPGQVLKPVGARCMKAWPGPALEKPGHDPPYVSPTG